MRTLVTILSFFTTHVFAAEICKQLRRKSLTANFSDGKSYYGKTFDHTFEARYAIDGVGMRGTNAKKNPRGGKGNFYNQAISKSASLEITMDRFTMVQTVNFFPRTDNKLDRYKGLKAFVDGEQCTLALDESMKSAECKSLSKKCIKKHAKAKKPIIFQCDIFGSTVSVSNGRNVFLQVAEVEIYGCQCQNGAYVESSCVEGASAEKPITATTRTTTDATTPASVTTYGPQTTDTCCTDLDSVASEVELLKHGMEKYSVPISPEEVIRARIATLRSKILHLGDTFNSFTARFEASVDAVQEAANKQPPPLQARMTNMTAVIEEIQETLDTKLKALHGINVHVVKQNVATLKMLMLDNTKKDGTRLDALNAKMEEYNAKFDKSMTSIQKYFQAQIKGYKGGMMAYLVQAGERMQSKFSEKEGDLQDLLDNMKNRFKRAKKGANCMCSK